MVNAKIQLQNCAQPIEHSNAISAYEKGSMYCVSLDNGTVHKYPINSIFRIVVEDYGYTKSTQARSN